MVTDPCDIIFRAVNIAAYFVTSRFSALSSALLFFSSSERQVNPSIPNVHAWKDLINFMCKK